MSDEREQIDDGGPACPLPDGTEYVRDYHPGHGETSRTVKVAKGGLTIRDYFAAKAMQGVISGCARDTPPEDLNLKVVAELAYDFADFMLKTRSI